jgi:hypothetical protein
MNPAKESSPGTSTIRESTTTVVPNVKTMLGRVWAVAELLAEAASRETNVTWLDPASEKTQH